MREISSSLPTLNLAGEVRHRYKITIKWGRKCQVLRERASREEQGSGPSFRGHADFLSIEKEGGKEGRQVSMPRGPGEQTPRNSKCRVRQSPGC